MSSYLLQRWAAGSLSLEFQGRRRYPIWAKVLNPLGNKRWTHEFADWLVLAIAVSSCFILTWLKRINDSKSYGLYFERLDAMWCHVTAWATLLLNDCRNQQFRRFFLGVSRCLSKPMVGNGWNWLVVDCFHGCFHCYLETHSWPVPRKYGCCSPAAILYCWARGRVFFTRSQAWERPKTEVLLFNALKTTISQLRQLRQARIVLEWFGCRQAHCSYYPVTREKDDTGGGKIVKLSQKSTFEYIWIFYVYIVRYIHIHHVL